MSADLFLKKHQDKFEKATTHPLTNELCQGTLPDYKLYTYLVQDLKYFQLGLCFFGKTLAYCDDADAAVVLGKQIGFVSNDENDYFERALREMRESSDLSKVPHMLGNSITLPEVKTYLRLLEYLVYESKSYVELITALYVMEEVYLGWANYQIKKGIPESLEYKYKEWIVLHSGQAFETWVQFLKKEVDRVAPSAPEEAENMFLKALELEISFFDACYNYGS